MTEKSRDYDDALASNEVLCTIEIQEDGSIFGWCATLRKLGFPCPLEELDGIERRCEDCHCG